MGRKRREETTKRSPKEVNHGQIDIDNPAPARPGRRRSGGTEEPPRPWHSRPMVHPDPSGPIRSQIDGRHLKRNMFPSKSPMRHVERPGRGRSTEKQECWTCSAPGCLLVEVVLFQELVSSAIHGHGLQCSSTKLHTFSPHVGRYGVRVSIKGWTSCRWEFMSTNHF